MKPTLLLDKSFVQGVTTAKMHALADSHRLLVSDALFYELISNPRDRHICFAKFPSRENPVEFVMHVGGHLRREIETRKPSGRPSQNVEEFRFEFNEELLSDSYELSTEAAQVLAEHDAELQSDVGSFISRAKGMKRFFPEVFVGSDAQRAQARLKVRRVIVGEKRELLRFYGKLQAPPRRRGFPRKRHLTEEWALFRWLQVQMLFGLDLSWRYGVNLWKPLTSKQYEKLEHDVLDAQYLLLGVLEGAFATQERKLQEWFTALRPDGTLYTVDDHSFGVPPSPGGR
jgi:hypothetical protein